MSITTGDAVRVMRHVAACHHRTAPRLDDPEAVKATAGIWARMFNRHDLTLDLLLAAVERRGESEASAPEPAEIIEFARKIRSDAADAGMVDPAIRAAREQAIDAKVARALGPVVAKFGALDRPATRAISAPRRGRMDPAKRAEVEAQLDVVRNRDSA